MTVQKAPQGSEAKELREGTKESNDFLDEGSLISSQINDIQNEVNRKN